MKVKSKPVCFFLCKIFIQKFSCCSLEHKDSSQWIFQSQTHKKHHSKRTCQFNFSEYFLVCSSQRDIVCLQNLEYCAHVIFSFSNGVLPVLQLGDNNDLSLYEKSLKILQNIYFLLKGTLTAYRFEQHEGYI